MSSEGTNCNYCNGDVRHGSRKKTPYIVGISRVPRLLAHAMQQSQAFRVTEDEGGENRESNFSLAQPRVSINREIVPSLSVTLR